jgi:hypothetical protein
MLSSQSHKPHVTRGFRTGIVLGLVIAALGIAVGTVTGATTITPFQQVVVVNPPASPIPVTGTVNIGNTPANQTVTVSNFPATQPVSGSVSVSNFPATQPVTVANSIANKGFQSTAVIDAGDDHVFVPIGGGVINVSFISISTWSLTSERIQVGLQLTQSAAVDVYSGDTEFRQTFTSPVAIRGVEVTCLNAVFSCSLSISVIGS